MWRRVLAPDRAFATVTCPVAADTFGNQCVASAKFPVEGCKE
jgi:hypothetical protein